MINEQFLRLPKEFAIRRFLVFFFMAEQLDPTNNLRSPGKYSSASPVTLGESGYAEL